MNDHDTDIHDLLRQAIISQTELGHSEVVLADAEEVRRRIAESAPAVSEVVEEPGVSQASLDTQPSPEFESLEVHREAICDCTLCPLGKTRTKFVYGVGNPNADLMFIGEAPGAEEDRQGEPFVGAAGQLLDKILAAMKLERGDIYIANILKCRPPGNRDPQPDEMERCFPFLKEQVRLIRPKIICALGRISAQALLSTSTPLGKLRGSWHEYEGVPLLVTYHPAALLRFQQYKRPTWEDMQKVMARLEEFKGQ